MAGIVSGLIGVARGLIAVAALGLTGCAMYFDPPSVAEAPMTVGERKVVIESLACEADGRVIAAGYADSLTSLEGVVLYSSDRGSTWLQAAIEPRAVGISLSTVEWPAGPGKGSTFVSGYRVGENLLSGISRSSYPPGPWWSSADGGRSWRSTTVRMPLPPTSDIGLGLPQPVVGDAAGAVVVAAGDGGGSLAVLRSTDGGKTWQRQSLSRLGHYGSIVSDGLGSLALSGRSRHDAGVVYWSADSGATWSESEISTGGRFPFKAPAALRLYRSPTGALIAFNNDSLGKGRSPAWIFASADDGRSWSFAQAFGRVGRIVGIGIDGEGRIVAVTEWGHVLLGDKKGTTWALAEAVIPVKPSTAVSQVIFGPDGVALAAQYRGGIFRSTDGGRTWRRVDSGLPDRQFDLNRHCIDGMGLVVVAGGGGMLTRSTDWGATWQPGRIIGSAAASQ
jgi:photosystem II stability/assembly factor-like uncharacterized protein